MSVTTELRTDLRKVDAKDFTIKLFFNATKTPLKVPLELNLHPDGRRDS